MKTILNIIAMTTLLVTNVSAEVVTPYGVFNPLAMFDTSAYKKSSESNSAFYNYGNQGYDFVVNSIPAVAPTLQTQLASLDR